GFSAGARTLSTIFDIDYADGLGGPNATISVFDSLGNLILVSRDSNVTSDHAGPNEGNGVTDLARGSGGQLDPYIMAQMPTGSTDGIATPGTGPFTYYVAISSDAALPTALNATFVSGSVNNLVRLQPVTSVRRIVEDHIGFTGFTSGD